MCLLDAKLLCSHSLFPLALLLSLHVGYMGILQVNYADAEVV